MKSAGEQCIKHRGQYTHPHTMSFVCAPVHSVSKHVELHGIGKSNVVNDNIDKLACPVGNPLCCDVGDSVFANVVLFWLFKNENVTIWKKK